MSVRLRVFATHPVQYHVPLWRALASAADVDLKVLYLSDHGLSSKRDKDFGLSIKWDVNLTDGYNFEFLARDGNLDAAASISIPDVDGVLSREHPDWVLISGHHCKFQRQLLKRSRYAGARVLMRGEFSDGHLEEQSRLRRLARLGYLAFLYRRVDRFCFPGETARSHLRRHGIDDADMFFSPYSVDNDLFSARAAQVDRVAMRHQMSVPDRCFLFLFSGKLIRRKDPLVIVDALKRVATNRQVGLIVLGDGELKAELEQRARAFLGERFVSPGFVNQSDLSKYFVAADALVLPSRQETWGLVVNEAMLHGLPVLASDRVGCGPDLIVPGQTGYTFRCGDPHELAELMLKLIDAPLAAQAMGRAARTLVARYSVEASARGILTAITQ